MVKAKATTACDFVVLAFKNHCLLNFNLKQ